MTQRVIRRFTNLPSEVLTWINPNPYDPLSEAGKDTSTRFLRRYIIQTLKARVYDVAIDTPLTYAHALSAICNNHVYLKREDTQPVFSFKIRGAYNKIANLTPSQLEKGIVTCSAGNHAQGVALSAKRLNINATIVMPLATPAIKVDAVRRFGGSCTTIVLHGKNYDEASAEANRLVQEEGRALVHPFDDPLVIAGQSTIGKEILQTLSDPDKQPHTIFACVGGGGLLAGIALYVKAVNPDIKVIGVEAFDAAGMTESLRAGKVITLPRVGLFADGAAVKTVGKNTFEVCNELVDEMMTVHTDEICAAIKCGFNDTRVVMEPAGALAMAGLVKYSAMHPELTGQTFVAICSGANMDFDRLRFVSERADSNETLLSVEIPEIPGSFRELNAIIHPRNITEFSYRVRHNEETAHVMLSYQTLPGQALEEDLPLVMSRLQAKGYPVKDLSDNELAKAHTRYLSGGRATSGGVPTDFKEVVYRFEFPESPGALKTFLDLLHELNTGSWSISLFHYRNHGNDSGRVMVGLLVKDSDKQAFDAFLQKLNYWHCDETHNPAYWDFVR
jgi:threonine dehydratase